MFNNDKDKNDFGRDNLSNSSSSNYSYGSNFQNSPFYYSESYKKKKNKKGYNLFQLILIAVMSSILGGGIVFSFPVYCSGVQPGFDNYFNSTGSNITSSNSATKGQELKSYKIEIEKSNSPVTWIAKRLVHLL